MHSSQADDVREIQGGASLQGSVQVPADKSLTHRSIMFSAMAEGESEVIAHRAGADNASTAECFARLGVESQRTETGWQLKSPGVAGWKQPDGPLDCGNSGTSMRLLSGILSAAPRLKELQLIGDASLQSRPMKRITAPLRQLGAHIEGVARDGKEYPPLKIDGARLKSGHYDSPVASAQIKSALLLAGAVSGIEVSVTEPRLSRDHSERMLQACGFKVETTTEAQGVRIEMKPTGAFQPRVWEVPSDPSSAAFFLVAAAICKSKEVTLLNVGINPTRTGFLDCMQRFGIHIVQENLRTVGAEPVADLRIASIDESNETIHIEGEVVPRAIDEIPVLAMLAAFRPGQTTFADLGELRVKESDRVAEIVRVLTAFGVRVEQTADSITVYGGGPVKAAELRVDSDHRIAMSSAVLALGAEGRSRLHGTGIAEVSFPGFFENLRGLGVVCA